MTPERFRSIEEVYHAARNREPGDRSAFLAEVCAGDEALKRQVESLLEQDSGSRTGILDHPAAELLPESAPKLSIRLASGKSLGQYRILEHLGAGGMGTVYKATDTKLNRHVALKMLRPELLDDPASAARLKREARTLASLNHPHIAVIYGLEEHEGFRFLALEYVPGPTLSERLRRGPLPILEATRIAKPIAEALEAAHAKGIMHRDLKPANIKVGQTGTHRAIPK